MTPTPPQTDGDLRGGNRLLSVAVVAEHCGVSVRTVYRWLNDGLPCYRTGRTKTFIWSEYLAWLKTKRVQPASSHAQKRAGELLNENARHGR